jgi:tetratricopeptide (TPR) repeat protein
LLPLLVAAATLVAFLPAINNGLTNWDDPVYVTDNSLIRDLSPNGLRAMFTGPVAGNYHPLTIASLALDYRLGKLSPKGYHVTNIALHLFNTLAVFWLVLLLTRSPGASTIAALFFGVHPLHVESVAWVSGRKDVLYTAFYLCACICFALWATGGRRRRIYYVGALAFFALSLLSKAMAATLPLALALIDWYVSRSRAWKRRIVELLPFLALSVAFGIIAILMQRGERAIQEASRFPIHERVLYASYGILAYLFRAVAPIKLSAIYPYPDKVGGALPAYFYVAPFVVAGIAAAVAWSLRRTRDVAFGMLFFLVNLVMVLQLIPVGNAIIADRYTYLSFVGIGFVLGSGFRHMAGVRSMKLPAMILVAAAAASLVVATRARCEVWRDSMHLWEDTVAKAPNSPVARSNRALGYMTLHKWDQAMADLDKALAIDPTFYNALANRGNIEYNRGQHDAALRDLGTAVKLKPSGAPAWAGLGAAHFAVGAYDRALEDFGRAIALRPDYAEVYLNRANLLSFLKRYDRALPDYDAYIRLQPGNSQAYSWRGIAKEGLGDPRGAVQDYDAAIRLDPKRGDAFLARSKALESMKRFEEALRDAERARALGVQVDPGFLRRLTLEQGVKR